MLAALSVLVLVIAAGVVWLALRVADHHAHLIALKRVVAQHQRDMARAFEHIECIAAHDLGVVDQIDQLGGAVSNMLTVTGRAVTLLEASSRRKDSRARNNSS